MKGLKTYFTFLEHNKLFTLVNVAGLSISLMLVLLIADMVTRQLTVDKDLPDADRISIFANEVWAGAHYNLGDRLQSRYPEIEEWSALTAWKTAVEIDGKPVTLTGGMVRKNFFLLFRFPVFEGSREHLLADDNGAVITRSAAKRLFGTEHAMGMTMKVPDWDDQTYTVTGIIEDIDNSVISSEMEIFLPYENMRYINPACAIEDTHMSNAASAALFVRTTPGSDLNQKEADMVAYMKEFFWIYQYETVKHARFIPLRDFYFSGTPSNAMLNQYDFKLVIIFLTTGLLILFMAVFNYVSMSLAQTSYRAKEMATRRLLGSSRPEVFWRMIAESFILTLTSFVAGFLMAKAVEPKAMELLNVRLDLAGDLSAPTVLAYIALTAVLSLLAGFVPATILSNYNPMDVVKGTFRRKTKAVYLRMLNIVQCGLTAAMLACSLYLSIQIYRILHAPLGYEYGHVLIYEAAADLQNLQRFRDEVKKLPYVKRVSFSQGTPHSRGNNNTTYIPVADSSLVMSFQTFVADSTFFDIYHIRITEDRHTLADEAHVFLSEKAMKDLESAGLKDYYPVGNGRVNIAGVFKDFHIGRSLIDNDIHPLQIMVIPSDHIYPWNISVEVQDGDLASYQKETDRLYSEAIGGIPFESKWYGDLMTDLYSDFTRMNKLMAVFTCAAFLISLLGLTAMSLYFIAQRKRDIAIRKAFGSSTRHEQWKLMHFSLISVGISLLIAVPLTIFGIHQIDKIVTYDSSFPWWVPITAYLTVAALSIGSVWLISLKATRENPVNNLKTE